MKSSKKRERSRQRKKDKSTSPTEQSIFSLAADIEASATTTSSASSPQQQQRMQPQRRKIFNSLKTLKKSSHSQQSIATNASFVTAHESEQPNEPTPAASYIVESSDEDTNEGFNFDNDPLTVLSRSNSIDTTPTEISFNTNPEETTIMQTTMNKIAPFAVEATPAVPPPATTAPATKKDPQDAVVTKATKEDEEEAHFDIAQNVYGTAKNFWAWGKTIPVVTTFLGLTETVATKVLDTTIHMDLPAIDEKGVKPQLKRLDDDLFTPVILAVWKIIEPAVHKGDEMVVKPVLTEVLPWVLGPFDKKKKEEEKKKKVADEKKAMIDSSPTPEMVPAFN